MFDIDAVPQELAIEINKACIFSCSFCFYKNYYKNRDPSLQLLPYAKVCSLLDEAALMGIPTVRFIGGDPILRPDIHLLVQKAKEKGLYVIMNTNAVGVAQGRLDAILSQVDLAIISLHGYDDDSQQKLTGNSSTYTSVLKAIRRYSQLGNTSVMVSTICSVPFVHNWKRYALLLEKLGVLYWSINRAVLPEDFTNPLLSPHMEEVVSAIGDLDTYIRNKPMRVTVNNYPRCAFTNEIAILGRTNNSTNGRVRLFYDIEGYFKPSSVVNINLGTVLAEAWRSNPMRVLDETVPLSCMKCTEVRTCGGGSRTAAVTACEYKRPDSLMPNIPRLTFGGEA